MANSIALFKNWVTLLDKAYKQASLTGFLDGNPDLVRAGANANEIIIPKMSLQGLGSYSRNSGYVSGDVTMTNETVACNFDRGRMFTVDAMDNIETAGLAFGQLAGEFLRTKVVPELDAFRIAKYAQISGISKATPASMANAAGSTVLTALRAAASEMDDDEVPYENRILFILSSLMDAVDDLDTTKSRAVVSRFSRIVRMPSSRMYTRIHQRDGSSAGETDGGYLKYPAHYEECVSTDTGALHVVTDATASPTSSEIKLAAVTPVETASYTPEVGDYVRKVEGKGVNFLVVHKDAVIQFSKHIAPKVISPEQNQSGDGWKFGYRHVAIADAYENKVAGIYLHASTT